MYVLFIEYRSVEPCSIVYLLVLFISLMISLSLSLSLFTKFTILIEDAGEILSELITAIVDLLLPTVALYKKMSFFFCLYDAIDQVEAKNSTLRTILSYIPVRREKAVFFINSAKREDKKSSTFTKY